MVKSTGSKARPPWVAMPALACPSCVTLAGLPALSGASFLIVRCRQ